MTAFWVFLALLVGAVACRVAWTRGVERGRALANAAWVREQDSAIAERDAAEAARLATIRENRSAGARQAWETRKAQRATRGES